MLLDYVYVVPTPETQERLHQAFSHLSFSIDVESISCEICTTAYETPESVLNPNILYEATVVKLGLWYDTAQASSTLILQLNSPMLEDRHRNLCKMGLKPYWFQDYFPHIALKRQFPPLSRSNRSFIASMSNVLATAERPFYFTGESVIREDFITPLDYDFNVDMRARASEGTSLAPGLFKQ